MNSEKFKTLQTITGLTILFFSIFFLLKQNNLLIKERFLIEDLKKEVVDSGTEIIRKQDNDKPVFMSGVIRSSENLKDEEFGIEIYDALQLKRIVKVFQWQETISQDKKQNLYSYKKDWSEKFIDSDNFKFSDNYKNLKDIPFKNILYDSKHNYIGVYSIPNYAFEKIWTHDFIDASKHFTLEVMNAPEGFKIIDGKFFKGKSIISPEIGDVLVEFYAVRPFEVTVVGMQNENKILPYKYKNKQILIVKRGVMSLDGMFSKISKKEMYFLIFYNVISFILITFAFLLLKSPFHDTFMKIPYFWELFAYASKTQFLAISILFSAIITSLSWIVYKTLISFIVIGISFVILIILREKNRL